MKQLLQRALSRLGYRLVKTPASPYEALRQWPRYEPRTISLLGQPFDIVDGRSFYSGHREIFLEHIYRFAAPTDRPRIVDCGANVGTSIAYFKQMHPQCVITAVEADPRVFAVVEQNVAQRGYQDVTLLNRAVSDSSEPLQFTREGGDGGRIHHLAEGSETVEVQPVRLDELLEQPVDFLKIDIEGAETDSICGSQRLDRVTQMFVEYHSFADAPQNLSELLGKLQAEGFRYLIHTMFCSRRPLTEESLQLGMDLQLNIFAKRDAR